MKLINDWYCFMSAIDNSMCEKLIMLGKNKFKSSKLDYDAELAAEKRIKGRNKSLEDNKVNRKRRKSKIFWIEEQWVFNLIYPFMERANEKSGWNFDIKACEAPQLTKYKKNDFFKWHVDGRSDSLSVYNIPNNKFLHKNVRKISMIILLNEGYEGGKFQFGFFDRGKMSISTPEFLTKGSIIFFPSFINHQITPVMKGTRYSLVAWFVGPPFK